MNLNDYDLRHHVMAEIGKHPFQYDFDDSSELEDAVQIVIEALSKVLESSAAVLHWGEVPPWMAVAYPGDGWIADAKTLDDLPDETTLYYLKEADQ